MYQHLRFLLHSIFQMLKALYDGHIIFYIFWPLLFRIVTIFFVSVSVWFYLLELQFSLSIYAWMRHMSVSWFIVYEFNSCLPGQHNADANHVIISANKNIQITTYLKEREAETETYIFAGNLVVTHFICFLLVDIYDTDISTVAATNCKLFCIAFYLVRYCESVCVINPYCSGLLRWDRAEHICVYLCMIYVTHHMLSKRSQFPHIWGMFFFNMTLNIRNRIHTSQSLRPLSYFDGSLYHEGLETWLFAKLLEEPFYEAAQNLNWNGRTPIIHSIYIFSSCFSFKVPCYLLDIVG